MGKSILFIILTFLTGVSARALEIQYGAAGPVSMTAAPYGNSATARTPVKVMAKSSAARARMGDAVVLEFNLQPDPGVLLLTPQYEKELGENWVLQKAETVPVPSGSGTRLDRLTLAGYLTGETTLPVFHLPYQTPDGRRGEITTPSIPITLDPPQPGPHDKPGLIHGLKPPQGMWSWWYTVWVVLGALIAAGAAWWYFRKQQLVLAASVPAAPARPPAEVARERLAALKAAGKMAAGDAKGFYVELSDILRHYLEGRYVVPALDRTTPELSRALKALGMKLQDLTAVKEVLEASDLVKFAKFHPTAAEADKDWQAVADVVERTAPAEAETGLASP